MGEQESYSARYFLADPQGAQPISVEVPTTYPGDLALVDLCADLPARTDLSERFEESGLAASGAGLLVLRASGPDFLDRINPSEELRSQIPEEMPVLCLIANADTDRRPLLVAPSWAATAAREPTLEELRSIEMLGLLHGRGAILAHPDGHYEAAGGSHMKRYLRLRNALESPRDCRRVIDWMLPSIEEGSQILIAHRGLGAFEATLEARLGKIFKGRVEIHRLPRYDESDGGDPHLPVSMKPDQSRHQVVVIGVDVRREDSLGRFGDREHTLDVYGFGGAEKVRLVDTTFPEPASAEAFAHVPIERTGAASCEDCKHSSSELFYVDPDDEIPIPTSEREPLRVVTATVKSNKGLWKVVERTGAAAVHVNQRYEFPKGKDLVRHRAVDIDVGKLLGDSGFFGECRAKLASFQTEDCIVLIPDHEAAPELMRLAELAIPYEGTSIHVVPRLDPVASVGPEVLDSDRILILDDMTLSGATMGLLVRKLKAHFEPARFAAIDLRGFAVLNCAPSRDHEKRVRAAFTPGEGAPRFESFHRVPLPHPAEKCPWCEERARLEGPLRESLEEAHPEFLQRRLEQLDAVPFRHLSPVADAGEELHGTFIGDISARTAFACWASALQEMRFEMRTPGEGRPSYYVDVAHVAVQWRDWAQCGGILRTAGEREVRYAYQEREFEEAWETFSKDMELGKIAEFGWAALEGKLTSPSAALVLETLTERADEDLAIAALAALLNPPQQSPGDD